MANVPDSATRDQEIPDGGAIEIRDHRGEVLSPIGMRPSGDVLIVYVDTRPSARAAMERILTELGFVQADAGGWFAGRRIDCGRAAPDLAELLDREGE